MQARVCRFSAQTISHDGEERLLLAAFVAKDYLRQNIRAMAVVLFDRETSAPVAIIDAAALTATRTAAASGLATRLLAREGARTCGIFGTGAQAVAHIEAMCAVRRLEQIRIWGRDFAKAEALAAQQARRTGRPVSACRDPAAVGACDLICTVTGASEPILKGEWVRPGAHVNLVGSHSLTSREADTELIAKSAVYVDLMESARWEAGDVMLPMQDGAVGAGHIVGEFGQLLAGQIPGRTEAAHVRLYKSVGIAAQDLYAAEQVYARARAYGAAVEVDF